MKEITITPNQVKSAIQDLLNENERLKDENEKLTKEWLKSQGKRRKAIEYIHWRLDNRQDMYITQMEELLEILKGNDK